MSGGHPLHVAARCALLDALEAAAPFRRSLIVVGAQAVYLRTIGARLALAPFTTDGDLVIDPSLLPATPALDRMLEAAGFSRSLHPGSWRKAVLVGDRTIDVEVDFMVPEAVAAGSGRRSVDLAGHHRLATRRVAGLEAALVDHAPTCVDSMDPADRRSIMVEVAGPAALFIAKIHKIGERVESGRHRRTPVDKDAADVYRLTQTTSMEVMASGFQLALETPVARPVAIRAMRWMEEFFGRPRALGVQMATRAIGVAGEAPETIAAVLTGYTRALLRSLRNRD